MKRWLLPTIPLLALVLLASLFFFYALKQQSTRIEPNATLGKPAPDLHLSYVEGGPPVSLLSQIDGPVLVNVFGSWCAPCAEESPALMAMQAKGARIIGIDEGQRGERDDPEALARFLTRYGDPYDVIFNDPGSLGSIGFGATGVPETFVVDSKGMIVDKHTGPIVAEEDMARMMQALASAH